MEYLLSASTDKGNIKNTNQDSFGARIFDTPQGRMAFAVLCDGMGGLSKGEVASTTLVRAFEQWSLERLPDLCLSPLDPLTLQNEWTDLARSYNRIIRDYGSYSGIHIGTTLVAVLLTETHYYIINVGDSRAYEIEGYLRCLTQDQTLVAREVQLGNITPEQAETDSRRSVLLQCVGASEDVYPDFYTGEARKNAVYMLCSDGFRHEVKPEELYDMLQPGYMLSEEQMKQNLDYLIRLNMERSERDNITAIAVRTY